MIFDFFSSSAASEDKYFLTSGHFLALHKRKRLQSIIVFYFAIYARVVNRGLLTPQSDMGVERRVIQLHWYK
jgi:hypothetical protein